MKPLTLSKFVAAPVERTFDAFTDFEHAAENVRAIESLEILGGGPVAVGMRFRETRVMFKREATEEMEITALERPDRVAVGGESCGTRFLTEFRFTPEGGGTRVELEMRFEALTLFAKLMSPLGGLMAKSAAKQMQADLDDLAAVAEGKHGSSLEGALAT